MEIIRGIFSLVKNIFIIAGVTYIAKSFSLTGDEFDYAIGIFCLWMGMNFHKNVYDEEK